MEYDVVIVGAGPAGLAAACKLAQLKPELSICVLEKGAELGAHILSGAIFEPTALNELFPNWQDLGAPVTTKVTGEHMFWLGKDGRFYKPPKLLVPNTLNNQGNYVISLGDLCRWLGAQAALLGVDILPGCAAKDIIYLNRNRVGGVICGDMGVTTDYSQKENHTSDIALTAKYTLLAEGCRGHLGKQLIERYQLDYCRQTQHYSLGIKELWCIPDKQHQAGLVIHSTGWPLSETATTGSGFLYHLDNNQVAVGLMTDLSYSNPYLSPYDEFQRYKHHPVIAHYLAGGERISYGARAIATGGIQGQTEMVFPGGLLLGDNAGTLNAAKSKGAHTAMKSGMLAAEAVADAIEHGRAHDNLQEYAANYRQSWAYTELYQQRNVSPAIHKWGSFLGSVYAVVDINLFSGKLPWTFSDPIPDYAQLQQANKATPINYPKPDGKLSFDKLSSVFLANIHHEPNQPCRLHLKDANIPLQINLPEYQEPAQRYCPAGVYEIINSDKGEKTLQINAQYCLHCKACDIKDPSQNIDWLPPEGGGGPNYPNM
ncbi:MAG: electron transfer flavoprotein-ubiquinone oxidoreductase [Cellvibrionaceae bacterium]|nr:electron transfer flavoprotein-ubiquinone oxidoreductase [Cellvibrionaceae bacterium]